jgi:hypothetical protein
MEHICSVCNEVCEVECIVNCASCGDDICYDCLKECDSCGALICDDCIDDCCNCNCYRHDEEQIQIYNTVWEDEKKC